jgi:hypothetical protein
MLNFDAVLSFSHSYCVAVCAMLVPLNLLLTLRSLILVGLARPVGQIYAATGWAIAMAMLLVLHVASWFVVGVVMIQTFVLLSLGTICLAANLWAIGHSRSLERLLKALFQWIRSLVSAVSARVASS